MTQVLELSENAFEAAIIKIFQQAVMNMLAQMEKYKVSPKK